MTGSLEANAERLSLLSDDALLALVLVDQCAYPVHGVASLVVSLVSEVVDSKSLVASASFEVFDAS